MILTALTALAYPAAIQFKRGGAWVVLAPFAAFVWLIDVIANYTEVALVFDWPERGDYTITARVRRMKSSPLESRRELAKLMQIYLDACEPDGRH